MSTPFSRLPKGVIFDCDGVIVDSRSANIGYYNLLLHAMGKPSMTEEQAYYAQKSTAWQAFENMMTQEELQRLPELSSTMPYRETVLPGLKPMPGFEAFATRLISNGVRLALHTNRTEGIYDVLGRFSWEKLFDIVRHVGNSEPKPDPDGAFQILWEWGWNPADVLFVGDSDTDLGAAKGAGIPFVAFQNLKLDGDWHVNTFEEFGKLLPFPR